MTSGTLSGTVQGTPVHVKIASVNAVKQHCFHDTGIALLTDPPVHPQVCCHCGARRCRRFRRAAGHGPFLPAMFLEEWHTPADRECVLRESQEDCRDEGGSG